MLDFQDAQDALSRNVYGLLGVPIDADSLSAALAVIQKAVLRRQRLLISTVNLNFMVMSGSDNAFRQSLLASDYCTADGMPVVWVARALRIPVIERVAGSDLFDALVGSGSLDRKLRIVLFGGSDGVASKAAAKINGTSRSAVCVAAISPGFADAEKLSSPALIDEINTANADLLSVSLGAQKGQAWLLRNDSALHVPVRIHLGATINFQAGTVSRAPLMLRRLGAEWLWRIKEEPQLLKRYLNDGCKFLYLLVSKIIPLITEIKRSEKLFGTKTLTVQTDEQEETVRVAFSGLAWDRNIAKVLEPVSMAIEKGKSVVLDLTKVDAVDARFMGMVLVARELLSRSNRELHVVSANPRVTRQFELNCFGDLLSEGKRF
jgi:N-acetylglucosaminyldiphosphoundecaprenol N-acetyl-beta-D-mannosaminyltransferase